MRALILDPFVLPFLAFMAFLVLEGLDPAAVYYLYPVKTLVVGGLILWQWKKLPSLKPTHLLLSLIVGVFVMIAWVGLDPVFVKRSGEPTGFNPFPLVDASLAWTLIVFRILGASLVVPIMEELFWRGFLMRYLIKEDYRSIPLGTYQHVSFWVTTACFASVHGSQWPLAVVAGLLYGGLFLKTKNLGNIMVAHGFTNFLLGLYVLQTQRWYFW
jgi:CAAX prenyl protease-like protein